MFGSAFPDGNAVGDCNDNSFMHPKNDKSFEDEYFYFNPRSEPRPTSAPPILELSSGSLFAFRADYASVFSDIRCEESYSDFYQSYDPHEKRKLPPPLDTHPLLERDFREEWEENHTHNQRNFHANPMNMRQFEIEDNNLNYMCNSPVPRRATSKNMLDECVLDEDSLLPDLSSDSEPCSSADDVPGLVESVGVMQINPDRYMGPDHLYDYPSYIWDQSRKPDSRINTLDPSYPPIRKQSPGPPAYHLPQHQYNHQLEQLEHLEPKHQKHQQDSLESQHQRSLQQKQQQKPKQQPQQPKQKQLPQPQPQPQQQLQKPPQLQPLQQQHPLSQQKVLPQYPPRQQKQNIHSPHQQLPQHAQQPQQPSRQPNTHSHQSNSFPSIHLQPTTHQNPPPTHSLPNQQFSQQPYQPSHVPPSPSHHRGRSLGSIPSQLLPTTRDPPLTSYTPPPFVTHTVDYRTSNNSSPNPGVNSLSVLNPNQRASSPSLEGVVPPPGIIERSTPSPSPPDSLDSSLQQTPVCRYFIQGYCSRGERCNYAHIRDSTTVARQDDLSPPKERVEKKGSRLNRNNTTPPVNPPKSRRASSGNTAEPLPENIPTGRKPSLDHSASRLTSVDQVVNQVYALSKDQHGCRFLQKKLEENNPRTVEIIFNEAYEHIVELMTDPFGNYLCQKLLEYCSDKHRLLIIEKVATELVNISKNMHGTRAVQKLIEYLSSPTQIQLVINALRSSVVPLIQDLNGNHVIQRCLNKLSSEDNQFVYDAVASHCVEVATHRHGCCVLQRCIDHASDRQKLQLVQQITANALTLVVDPYGNYVVQYVLDLPYLGITAGLIRKFSGHLVNLSTQKFSSNVIEKCLNAADPQTRSVMIEEVLEMDCLPSLLQDPFANYVIQTALAVSEPHQHQRLVEAIRPHLPALRNTPYGKRIQNKILKETAHHR